MFNVRTAATADDSLAAIRARSRFGIAMAAMIRTGMTDTQLAENQAGDRQAVSRESPCAFANLR